MAPRRSLRSSDWNEPPPRKQKSSQYWRLFRSGDAQRFSANAKWVSKKRGIDTREARKQLREAARILRTSEADQTDAERTWALQTLGAIGDDQFYKGGRLATDGMEN